MFQNKNQNYNWKPSYTSVFTEQAKNLGEQAGTQGLNTGLIGVQNKTSEEKVKAAQKAKDVATKTPQAASQPTITPPDTSISTNQKFQNTYQDPTMKYLSTLFPQGLPERIKEKINKANLNYGKDATGPEQSEIIQPFQDYLTETQNNFRMGAEHPQDVNQFKNALQNQLSQQIEQINTAYQNGQMDLATQKSEKQKAVSDYIENLSKGLEDYQKQNESVTNLGQLSDLEKLSAEKNALIANPKTQTELFNVLHTPYGPLNTKEAVLSQQAQSEALQQAQGEAARAQENAKDADMMLKEAKDEEQKALQEGKESITKKQDEALRKLDEGSTEAQKKLADYYNNSVKNLTQQEQTYINNAQDILRNANVPIDSVKEAAYNFTNYVNNYMDDHPNMNDNEKRNLVEQINHIFHIVSGTPGADIHFTDDIANYFNPLMQRIIGPLHNYGAANI